MTYPDFSNNIISALVVEQLPEFVTRNYPNFVAFMEAYYEYLEQSGKLVNTLKNFPNYYNIDYVVENNYTNFLKYYQDTFLKGIPSNILVDKAKLIKHIKSFYSAKGTPKSFQLLFRILYNQDVNLFLNTGTLILKASAGNWYQPVVLRLVKVLLQKVYPTLGVSFFLGQSVMGTLGPPLVSIFGYNNISDWINTEIVGVTSAATAVVASAQTNIVNGIQYDELSISNATKQFLPNELIEAKLANGKVIIGQLLGVISGIVVDTPGTLYNVGDPVIITGGGGSNATAIVSQVSAGQIIQIGVADGGAGYQVSPSFAMNVAGGTINATAIVAVVNTSGTMAPNTFTINTDWVSNSATASYIANSPNTLVVNDWNTIMYSNCGPIQVVQVLAPGTGYTAPPVISVYEAQPIGNSSVLINSLGMIGELIITNGGQNYAVNDDIKIVSGLSRGVAAGAYVSAVNVSGAITSVTLALPSITGTVSANSGSPVLTGTGTKFRTELIANNNPSYPGSGSYILVNGETHRVLTIASDTSLNVDANFINSTPAHTFARLQGFPIGGFGYLQSDLPGKVTCYPQSISGTGATIIADSVIGGGASFTASAGTYGQVQLITVTSFGSGYLTQPTIDLSHSGDGTAKAHAQIIQGEFQYPGYFLNEDGMLSARRYLEDSQNYNNYTYRLTSPVAVSAYKDLVYNILNPAGMNMQGVTQILNETGNTNDIMQYATNYINIGSFIQIVSNGQIIYITTQTPFNDGIDVDFILDFSVLGGTGPGMNVDINFIVGASNVA